MIKESWPIILDMGAYNRTESTAGNPYSMPPNLPTHLPMAAIVVLFPYQFDHYSQVHIAHDAISDPADLLAPWSAAEC